MPRYTTHELVRIRRHHYSNSSWNSNMVSWRTRLFVSPVYLAGVSILAAFGPVIEHRGHETRHAGHTFTITIDLWFDRNDCDVLVRHVSVHVRVRVGTNGVSLVPIAHPRPEIRPTRWGDFEPGHKYTTMPRIPRTTISIWPDRILCSVECSWLNGRYLCHAG